MKAATNSGRLKGVTAMDRFFFNLASKERTIWDSKGKELGDLAAAHRHAMLLIHKMTLLDLDEVYWQGWSINVTDANYRSLLSVLFPRTACKYRKTANS
jgi:hypothetical protein